MVESTIMTLLSGAMEIENEQARATVNFIQTQKPSNILCKTSQGRTPGCTHSGRTSGTS